MSLAIAGLSIVYSVRRQRDIGNPQVDRIRELERKISDLEKRLSHLQAAYDQTVSNFGSIAFELRKRNDQLDILLPKLEWYQEILRQHGIVDRYSPGGSG